MTLADLTDGDFIFNAGPASDDWTGGGDGATWSDPNNWSLLRVPTGERGDEYVFGSLSSGNIPGLRAVNCDALGDRDSVRVKLKLKLDARLAGPGGWPLAPILPGRWATSVPRYAGPAIGTRARSGSGATPSSTIAITIAGSPSVSDQACGTDRASS